jgi:VCBS repeat-containing protein
MSFEPHSNTIAPTQKWAFTKITLLFITTIGILFYLTTHAKAATVPLQTVTLGWNAVPETDIQGYKVYVGTQSLQYTSSYLTGIQLTYSVAGLTSGQTYYFAVSAIGSTGLESAYSTELAVTTAVPPVAVADAYSTNQGTVLSIAANGVLTNDTDAQNRQLTAVLNVGPSHGSVILNADGSFVYTPVANYTGTDSFTYHANNGKLDSNITAVSLTIKALVAGSLANGNFESDFNGWTGSGNLSIESSLSYATSPDSKLVAFNGGDLPANGVLSQTIATVAGRTYTLTFDVGAYAYNKNTQSLLVTAAGTGSLLSQTITLTALGGGAVLWVPQSFTFVADRTSTTLTFSDKSSTTSSIDLLLDNVRVTEVASPTNTAPTAVADTYTTNQNTILIAPAPGLLANDTDAESNPLTAILNVGPSHGTLALNSSGGFTYTPTTGYSGTDSFTYHANDGSLNSNIATVSLTINAQASAIVVNGSFETDFTGWTKTGNQSVESALPYKATAGSKLVVFNSGDLKANAVLSQTLTTVIGQTYTLSFDAGVFSYNKNQQKIQITVVGNKSLLSKAITLTGLGGGSNLWLPQKFTFVADRTSVILTFRDQSSVTSSIDLMLDNVQVTGPSLLAATVSTSTLSTMSTTSIQSPLLQGTKLSSPTLKVTPGAATMSMAANQAGTYILERSDDLITWEFVSELHANAPGAIEFQADHKAAKAGKAFYRVGFRPN